MDLIPQLYVRNRRAVSLEHTISPIFDEDPFVMASRIKEAGAETVFIIDLGIPHVGTSENIQVIQKISEELGLGVIIGGGFRSAHTAEAYLTAGMKFVVLETIAYQQPMVVREMCRQFPESVGVHISVHSGRVTIPGWTVAANKSAIDYAKQFLDLGVKHFTYSDVGNDGFLANDNLANILDFCKKIHSSVIIASEIRGSQDIEKIVTLGAPGLDGLILTRALYEGKVDLKASISLVYDLSAARGNEPTLPE